MSFQCVQERSFFSADVSPRAGVDMDRQAETRAEKVMAEESRLACFTDGSPERMHGRMIGPAHEHIGTLGLNGIGRDNDAFDQAMGMTFEQQAIFKTSRLHLVGVDHEIFGTRRIGSHRDEAPFLAGRKPGTSAPT